MSTHISTQFTPISGTAAGLGKTQAGRFVVADRPEGVAGGQGLGSNGAELLSAALGGCFWNDLHYVIHDASLGVEVGFVEAEVELAGKPPRVVRAHLRAHLCGAPDKVLDEVFDTAASSSTVAASVSAAFEVSFERLAVDGQTTA